MFELIQRIRWRPEIGDPSTMGWVTVLAYGLAAFTCWLAAKRTGRSAGTAKGSRPIWILVATLMTFLCLNKQLDLQSLLTEVGRLISWQQGWYEDRRDVQKTFILLLLASITVISAGVLAIFHVFWRRHLLLAAGLAFLIGFVSVRAVSFHHFDVFLKSSHAGVKMNWLLELTGIAMVWLAAWFDYRYPLGLYPKRLIKPY